MRARLEDMAKSKFPARPACLLAFLALGAPAAWGGGDLVGADENPEDQGPSYFGFVKDARGAPVPDAKVTANVKNGVAFITRTTAAGLYKFGGFSKQINPDDVTIACAKEGYRQTRVVRRPPAKAGAAKAIETECRLERN
jgi:hypothetical protein